MTVEKEKCEVCGAKNEANPKDMFGDGFAFGFVSAMALVAPMTGELEKKTIAARSWLEEILCADHLNQVLEEVDNAKAALELAEMFRVKGSN